MTVMAREVGAGFGLYATACLSAEAFARVRRCMVLEGCKWDAQVGDVGVLAPFALVLRAAAWEFLAGAAEQLARETCAAEEELLGRPELWGALAIPRRLRAVMARGRVEGFAPAAARVMRFDFHPTVAGWRVSEVNSDVPGGYSESTGLPRLMAEAVGGGLMPIGDPTAAWVEAMVCGRRAGDAGIGLLCAPGYTEDRQIMMYLVRALGRAGCPARCVDLHQLRVCAGRWCDGATGEAFGALLRFYQAEWLAALPRACRWEALFAGSGTPVCNPAVSVFSEKKAFPLTWDRLRTPLPGWRSLLPETRGLGEVDWQGDPAWLLKEAFSNNGDSVLIREAMTPGEWRRARRSIFWRRRAWVAQRRFEGVAVETPEGLMQACLGVYVIDGKAAGIYGRITGGAVIDYAARDVAVLVQGAGE